MGRCGSLRTQGSEAPSQQCPRFGAAATEIECGGAPEGSELTLAVVDPEGCPEPLPQPWNDHGVSFGEQGNMQW